MWHLGLQPGSLPTPLACLFALQALCSLERCSPCPCQPVPKRLRHLTEEISHSLQPRTYTEEELNAKLTRRVQKAARRQAKQEELKRLHRAQVKPGGATPQHPYFQPAIPHP